MAGNVTRLFTRNWPIKLAAVFLALMLYVAVAAQQPISQSFDLKVTVLVPPGRALLEQPPPVSVMFTRKGGGVPKPRAPPRGTPPPRPPPFSGCAHHAGP